MMNKKHGRAELLLALASLSFLAACDDSSWDGTIDDVPIASAHQGGELIDDSAIEDDVRAVAYTADGAEVRFSEPTPGEIVIESTPGSSGDDPLAHPDLDALDATEVYELLTGEAAPTELVAAQRRLGARMEAAESEEDGGAGALAAATGTPIALTAEEFQALYCPNMSHCLLNQTDELRHKRRVTRVRGSIYAARGNVRVSVRRKRVGGWHQVVLLDVLEGQLAQFDSGKTIIRRRLKIEVTLATGGLYHIAYRF